MQRFGKLFSRHRKQLGQKCANWHMLYIFVRWKESECGKWVRLTKGGQGSVRQSLWAGVRD